MKHPWLNIMNVLKKLIFATGIDRCEWGFVRGIFRDLMACRVLTLASL